MVTEMNDPENKDLLKEFELIESHLDELLENLHLNGIDVPDESF